METVLREGDLLMLFVRQKEGLRASTEASPLDTVLVCGHLPVSDPLNGLRSGCGRVSREELSPYPEQDERANVRFVVHGCWLWCWYELTLALSDTERTERQLESDTFLKPYS